MVTLGIDIGYSSTKIKFNNEFYKVPTSISFANDMGIEYGENNVYAFEGEKYYVGESASDEAFTTTDYKFLFKFAPLIIYHIIKKLNIAGPMTVKTGLALTDWSKREEFQQRINIIKVDDQIITTGAKVVGPQGSGAYNSYISDNALFDKLPNKMSVIDIGYRTINFLYYEKGVAQQNRMKGFPGHGVVSIIKTFTSMLESTYGINFSEQEALKIFMDGHFSFGGTVQEQIPAMIEDLKNKFKTKLMQSVLVSENKLLQLSDKVLITGGGSYFLKNTPMPPNTCWSSDAGRMPDEFANVSGYMLVQ